MRVIYLVFWSPVILETVMHGRVRGRFRVPGQQYQQREHSGHAAAICRACGERRDHHEAAGSRCRPKCSGERTAQRSFMWHTLLSRICAVEPTVTQYITLLASGRGRNCSSTMVRMSTQETMMVLALYILQCLTVGVTLEVRSVGGFSEGTIWTKPQVCILS